MKITMVVFVIRRPPGDTVALPLFIRCGEPYAHGYFMVVLDCSSHHKDTKKICISVDFF